ncbi:hypothetical protein L3Q82_019083, partial [Scortum barcoo]
MFWLWGRGASHPSLSRGQERKRWLPGLRSGRRRAMAFRGSGAAGDGGRPAPRAQAAEVTPWLLEAAEGDARLLGLTGGGARPPGGALGWRLGLGLGAQRPGRWRTPRAAGRGSSGGRWRTPGPSGSGGSRAEGRPAPQGGLAAEDAARLLGLGYDCLNEHCNSLMEKTIDGGETENMPGEKERPEEGSSTVCDRPMGLRSLKPPEIRSWGLIWFYVGQPDLTLDELHVALTSLANEGRPPGSEELETGLFALLQGLQGPVEGSEALRLREAMAEVVHVDQTYCVPGRLISDNIHLIRHVLDVSGSLGIGTGLISIDQEKAFDRVEHQYHVEDACCVWVQPRLHWLPQAVLFLPKEEGGQGLVHLASRSAAFRLQFIQRLLYGPQDLVWRPLAQLTLRSVGGLGLQQSVFLMDFKTVNLFSLPVFYRGLFSVWKLLWRQRVRHESLFWLLQEPMAHGGLMSAPSWVGAAVAKDLQDCRDFYSWGLDGVRWAGPTGDSGIGSWSGVEIAEDRRSTAGSLESLSGGTGASNQQGEVNLKEAKGKVLSVLMVRCLNRQKLQHRSLLPWRAHLSLGSSVNVPNMSSVDNCNLSSYTSIVCEAVGFGKHKESSRRRVQPNRKAAVSRLQLILRNDTGPTPFEHHFKTIIQQAVLDKDGEPNPNFVPKLVKYFLPQAVLWSGLLLGDLGRHEKGPLYVKISKRLQISWVTTFAFISDFYSLPVPTTQLDKISKLLLSMEKGHLCSIEEKSLDEIEIEDQIAVSDAEAKDSEGESDDSGTAVIESECGTTESVDAVSDSTVTEQVHDTGDCTETVTLVSSAVKQNDPSSEGKDYAGGPWCPLTPEQEAMGATSQIVSILANTMSSSTTTAIFADNFLQQPGDCSVPQGQELQEVIGSTYLQQHTLNVTQDITRSMKDLESDIVELEEMSESTGDLGCIEILKVKKLALANLLESKVQGALVRSLFQNIAEMDTPSSFFFGLERKNGQKKVIHTLLSDTEQELVEPGQIRRRAVDFYCSLYSSEYEEDNTLQEEFCSELPQVSTETNSRLTEPLQLCELQAALRSMQGQRAPGIDGLTVEFYKAFWDVLAADILDVFNESLCQQAEGSYGESHPPGPDLYCVPGRSMVDNVYLIRDVLEVSSSLEYRHWSRFIHGARLDISSSVTPGLTAALCRSRMLSLQQLVDAVGPALEDAEALSSLLSLHS